MEDLDNIYNKLENNFVKYSDLVGVDVLDNDEKFFNLSKVTHTNLIVEQYKNDMMNYRNGEMFVRLSVARKIINISNYLKGVFPNISLKVVYAFRLLSIQKKYFNDYLHIVKKNNPKINNENELIELTHRGAAFPGVAGHPTGGAIDVGLYDNVLGEFLDMGSSILVYENTKKSYTHSPEVTENQLENRLLLKSLMEQEEFAPYLGEWWHFSYGDKEWAKFYEKNVAFYDQVSCISDIGEEKMI